VRKQGVLKMYNKTLDTTQSISRQLTNIYVNDLQSNYNDMLDPTTQDIKNLYETVATLVDFNLLYEIYNRGNIVDTYDTKDMVDYVTSNATQAIETFYTLNPNLLSDNFSLNDNRYHVDIRCIIIDFEDFLRHDKAQDE
jgi:hypothetical protein